MGTVFVFAEKRGSAAVSAGEDVDMAIIDCGVDTDAGFCLLRGIKQDRPDVPIIFVTDASSEEVVLRAFR